MLPRHLSRPFTMMARRVQSASHSSMLGRQGRLQQGGMGGDSARGCGWGRQGAELPRPSPGCYGPTTRDGRRQQRVSRAPSVPRAPAECHPLRTKEPPPTQAAPQVPGGITGAARSPPRPVRREHHGATRFDDVQDEVPEEAPCLGVHPCGGLVLGDGQRPQTHRPPGGPRHPLPDLSPAQDTIPHPRTLMAEPGTGSSHPGSFLHPSPAPVPGTRGVGGGPCGSPGHTRKMKAGYPISAMAVDSFLLLPPL